MAVLWFQIQAAALVIILISTYKTSQGHKILDRHRRSTGPGIIIPSKFFKEDFVNLHNSLRRQVNPQAANMKKMNWENELSDIAESVAQKCKYAHSSEEAWKHRNFDFVGENIYKSNIDPTYIVQDATQRWFDEGENYDFETSTCSGSQCGHYTQLVWADSNYIGCGIAYCQNLLGHSFGFLVVCEYGPGGNIAYLQSDGTIVLQRPYIAGTPCSNCTEFATCVNGLCSV